MNRDLYSLYQQDLQEHQQGLQAGTPEYGAMRRRDRARRKQADRILANETSLEAVDFYHAAWLFNHGKTDREAERAYRLARRAAEMGHRPARWLTAAAYDRWQMYQGKPQKYGTQIVPNGERYRVWEVDSSTTDAQRAEWDVPPLAEQQKQAEELTKKEPQPPMEEAPKWLKEAVLRWKGG